jgi:hypothetical protein
VALAVALAIGIPEGLPVGLGVRGAPIGYDRIKDDAKHKVSKLKYQNFILYASYFIISS